MIKAAGILFITPSRTALFLKRGPGSDCPGCWCFPGGTQEGDETAEQTAVRETKEEIGFLPEGERRVHTRQKTGPALVATQPASAAGPGAAAVPVPLAAPMPVDVDFTTFVQKVPGEFSPEVNEDEHVGYAWAPVGSPPEPLHPGCQVALDRLSMHELGVATAIAVGRLTSPQRYENMWLFALRITGTDTAYRRKRDEFVYRPPEHYLTDEFLARCNGLTVTYLHPPKSLLNSEEFAERVVGSVLLPYIDGDEVWGIAKIYDDHVAALMEEKTLSTSPAVFFGEPGVNKKMTLENGSTLLIEGKPSLLDHLAICEQGVWDKGGEPSGVRSETREDDDMPKTAEEMKADEEAETKKKADAEAEEKAKKDADEKEKAAEDKKKADGKKADADAGQKLDQILSGLDSMGKRMDAFEAKEKERSDAEAKMKADAEEEARKAGDPKQVAADKVKKDADEKAAEEKAKKDAEEKEAKAKADTEDVRKRIDEVASMIPKHPGDKDYDALIDAQAKADAVYAEFGKSAPHPVRGETAPLYRRRVMRDLKVHSPELKDADFNAVADDQALAMIEKQVYADATAAARNPVDIEPGILIPRTRKDPVTQQVITTFVGKDTFFHSFSRAPRYVTRFNTGNDKRA
jgi:8-oxo-dGTP pyrophosphatase MutT (NUDIX family)